MDLGAGEEAPQDAQVQVGLHHGHRGHVPGGSQHVPKGYGGQLECLKIIFKIREGRNPNLGL